MVDPNSGVTVEKISLRFSVSSYSLTPYFSQASVAITPIPPPLVMMTVFSPAGEGVLARNLHQLKASSTFSARRTPHCLMMASKISSEPASEPVCEAAAMAPRSDRPDLMTTTGIFWVVFLTASMSRSPSRTPSMYIKTIFVWGSVTRYSRRSASSTSVLFPTETMAERPMFSTEVLPIMATPRAPLWVMMATLPGLMPELPKVAFREAAAE